MMQLLVNSLIKAHSKEDEIRHCTRGCKMRYDNYFKLSMTGTSGTAKGAKYHLRRGFTLVEVLIVVVIISIAALMAVPMFSSAGSMQIRSAANIIAADLEYAKSMAITRGQNYSVVFDVTAESYKIEDQSGNVISHPVKKGFDYVVDFKNEGRLNKVDIHEAVFGSGASNTVTFDCMGSPLDGGSITIRADGVTETITVTPVTGYISITN